MPGVPDNVKNQMSKQVAAASGTEQCLTQEQADKEDVASALSKGYGDACTWSKNEIGSGKIDVRSEEHTSELQSLMRISYAVSCLKKQKSNKQHKPTIHTITQTQ